MTTITNASSAAETPNFADELTLEGQIEAILLQLDDSGRHADRQAQAETDRRFQRAESALELKRQANRMQLGASILSGVAGIAGGIGAMASAFGSEGRGSEPTASSTPSRVGATAQSVGGVASANAQPLERMAAEVGRRAEAADLAAERSLGHATRFGQHASADRAMRENLLRQLESILHERRRGDDAAVASQR